MNPGFLCLIFLALWVIIRIRRSELEEQTDQRSTSDILRSIEGKLDQLISLQAVENASKDGTDGLIDR
ncbi:MAG: hypothetical protein Q8K75_13105 [Chlamydiales bacterium]|nr:hypothetical protein [Chlamydiales bacterium]